MSFVYVLLGFGAKIITGFDDVITHIPILASVAKTRTGRLVFSLGTLLAIVAAILMAQFLAAFLKLVPYYRYILVALLFGLALAIHFDIFVHKPKRRAEEEMLKFKAAHIDRLLTLFGIGFISSFATVLDDVIVFSSLFTIGLVQSVWASVGILFATVLEIFLVIFFASFFAKIKYTEEIASVGLVLLGLLILAGVI